MELSELSSYQEASLFRSGLEEWQEGPQVLTYGAILICRKGKAMLNVNYKDWELYVGAVITLFPNDVVELKVDGDFEVEILKYNPSLFVKQACSWSRRCILPCGKTAAGRIPLW